MNYPYPPADLRELYAFLLICETGSMTAAAQQLKVTQSAISQIVRQLETNLGVTLFDRECRPMAITAAGERLREAAIELVARAEQLPALVREGSRAPLKKIRLGLVDSFASTMGADLIKALESQAHNVVAWSGLTPVLCNSLSLREVDLIVTTTAMENQEEFNSLQLFREPYVMVLPNEWHISADLPNVQKLAKQRPLIRYSSRSAIGQQIEHYLREKDIYAPYRYEFDATNPLLNMVVAKLGWAITTPICLLQGNYPPGAFQVLPLPSTDLSRRFMLSVRKHQFGSLPSTLADVAPAILHNHYLSAMQALAPWLTRGDFIS